MGDGLGSGLNTPVRALTHDPAGSLLAAGEFFVSGAATLRTFARWTGTTWTAPDPAFRGRAFAAARLTTGELALGGEFNGVDGLHDGFLKRWTFDGSPAIAEQPAPAAAHCGAPAAFTVRTVPGYGSTTFTWRHAGVPLDPLDPRCIVESDEQGSTLTIFPVLPGDAGSYDCLIALPCGSRASLPADLTITACCPADFNGDGFLDFFDYADFTACFEAGACPPGLTADFNGDRFVDFFDYADFVAAFEVGC